MPSTAKFVLPAPQRIEDIRSILNTKLGFTLTKTDMETAYRRFPPLSEMAVATAHTHAATLMRLLKIKPASLQKAFVSNPTLLRRAPHVIHGYLADTAALIGMPYRRYLSKVLASDRLMQTTPARAEDILAKLSIALSMSQPDTKRLIRHHPQLLASSPESLLTNARASASELGLPLEIYVRMIRAHPGLLAYPARTLWAHVDSFASALSIEFEDALRALSKKPSILALSPDTIQKNTSTTARLLDVPRHQWSRVCLKRAHLFGYRPAHIATTVRETADIFGMTFADVVQVALRFPAILTGRRETYRDKIPLVMAICSSLGFDYSPADTLQHCPLAYTYANDRLLIRLSLAKHGIGPRSIMNLLSLPEADAAIALATSNRSA